MSRPRSNPSHPVHRSRHSIYWATGTGNIKCYLFDIYLLENQFSSYDVFVLSKWILLKVRPYQIHYTVRTEAAGGHVFGDLHIRHFRVIPAESECYTIWAATWQNQQNDCAPSEDSDQPGHPPILISLHEESFTVLSYPLSAGWSEASLGTHSFSWFCHVVAHLNTSKPT